RLGGRMLRQMERSAIHLMAKRGKSVRQIAEELGRSPTTISRVLHAPVDRTPARRRRRSQVDPYRPAIEGWLAEGLSVVRMLELARSDPDQPYTGSRSQFGEIVRRIRQDREQQQAAQEVPIRFEGLAGEYLQVDWGEIRRFPFSQQPPRIRYVLCCRLKYSRWSWLRWTTDMRQETLLRGLIACFCALGFVPWVLVFDNMKTVTSGRDASHQPLWTPALLHLAAEFGFHPQACDPGAGNQKGSVESLVKWVKGNFLAGRSFTDDADLAEQSTGWTTMANERPSSATGIPPTERLGEELAAGGVLPVTAADYGLLIPGQVAADATVAVAGNRYSVPVAQARAPVTVRLHAGRIRIWRDTTLVADHPRAPDGGQQRIIDPAHFAPLFERKPRAQAMLYREVLLALGDPAPIFLAALSQRQRAQLQPELVAVYALYEQHGAEPLLAAMAQACAARTYNAAALALLLAGMTSPRTPLLLPGIPQQTEVDRWLGSYEAWVQTETVQEVQV
ncbi:MAG TPA: IS21 family transposase, partial [Chloroflexota bacterium]